jgi:hypothetical protein
VLRIRFLDRRPSQMRRRTNAGSIGFAGKSIGEGVLIFLTCPQVHVATSSARCMRDWRYEPAGTSAAQRSLSPESHLALGPLS